MVHVQAGFRKGRGTRDQIANIHWIMEKAREFQKNIYFCFIDYAKAFDCVDHNKLWKILKEREYQTTWSASCEICMQVRKQQLELDMEQQPWHTPFPFWSHSAVPCLVLTIASWPAYKFLKRQIRCSGIPSLSEFSTVYCDPHSQRLWHSQ